MSSTTAFVGSIPELYDRHLGPVLFEPYARDLAQRVPRGTRRVLEIAAGTGRVTRQLLAVLPGDGELVATDLNAAMIEHARKVVAPDPRLRWQVADALELPFPDHGFDLVACQFGLMFMPDKHRALGEMRRVLRAGGTLLLSTWDAVERNVATKLFEDVLRAELTDPPTFMATPFSMPDPVALGELVGAAGFATVQVDTIQHIGEAESAEHMAHGFVRGNPIWGQLVEKGIDAAGLERAVARAAAQAFGDRPCRSELSAHVVMAIA